MYNDKENSILNKRSTTIALSHAPSAPRHLQKPPEILEKNY